MHANYGVPRKASFLKVDAVARFGGHAADMYLASWMRTLGWERCGGTACVMVFVAEVSVGEVCMGTTNRLFFC
jgi:hypothetical protein